MERTINVEGYGELTGEFEQNQHGWFCNEINGVHWDYKKGVQPASKTLEEAATALLAREED
jgi:hypothetical protein